MDDDSMIIQNESWMPYLTISRNLLLITISACFLVLILLVSACIKCIRHYRDPVRVFKTLEIPMPVFPYVKETGVDLLLKEGSLKFYNRCASKYKDSCGIYHMGTYHIVVNDYRMIKRILQHDSWQSMEFKMINHFPSGVPGALHYSRSSSIMGSVMSLNLNWLPIHERTTICDTPKDNGITSITYTGYSTLPQSEFIDQMSQDFNTMCRQLLVDVSEAAGRKYSIDIMELMDSFALQSALKVVLGQNVDLLGGVEDTLSSAFCKLYSTQKLSVTVNEPQRRGWTERLASHIPFIGSWLHRNSNEKKRVWKAFSQALILFSQIIKNRKLRHKVLRYEDFLAILLKDHFKKNKVPSDMTLIKNSFSVFVSCYISLSSILVYTIHQLVMHQNKQMKLIKMVTEYYTLNEKDTLFQGSKSIPFVSSVIHEAIRLNQPCVWTSLRCTRSVTINEAMGYIHIPKGFEVILPLQAACTAHHNWGTTKYFPERFGPFPSMICWTNNPLHSQLITEFTMTGAKMALIAIFKSFKLLKTDWTKANLRTETCSVFENIHKPVDKIDVWIKPNRKRRTH